MPGLADLLHAGLTQQPDTPGLVLEGKVLDPAGPTVTVRSLDGGTRALKAFGTLPGPAVEGDPVRVVADEYGELVILAWEPA